jgi:hypothetical protein
LRDNSKRKTRVRFVYVLPEVLHVDNPNTCFAVKVISQKSRDLCKKAAQHFHHAVSKVFDRVKSVALWSANIRKLAKDHKDYGSAATSGTCQNNHATL